VGFKRPSSARLRLQSSISQAGREKRVLLVIEFSAAASVLTVARDQSVPPFVALGIDGIKWGQKLSTFALHRCRSFCFTVGAGIHEQGICLRAQGERLEAQSSDTMYSLHRDRMCVLEQSANK